MTKTEKLKIARSFFIDANNYNEEVIIGAFKLLSLIFNENIFYTHSSSIQKLIFEIKEKLDKTSSEVIIRKFALDGKKERSYEKLRQELPYISVYMIRSNYRKGIKELKYVSFLLVKINK